MFKEKGSITINDIQNNGIVYLNNKNIIIDFGISKKTIKFKQIKSLSNNDNKLELILKNGDIITFNLKSKDELYNKIKQNITNKKSETINPKKNKKYFFILIPIILLIALLTFFITNHSTSIKEARQSVLKINIYNKSGEPIQTGSGFVVFNKNILVTNAHVITNGYSAEAINENDERVFIKGIIYYNQDEDIAILKLNNQNSINPLKIENKYSVGDKVIAIGSPLGIKNSVSDGMISNIFDKDNNNLIQHSAPISSGSSGGVLLNKNNKVIGMNTASFDDGQNINISIPISTIEKVYKKVKNNKVQKINKIQLNDDKLIQSVMLNNNAGKQIIELIKKESENISIQNNIKDLKRIPEYELIYQNKDLFENILIIMGTDEINEEDNGRKRTLVNETTIPEIAIFKLNNANSDNKNNLKEILENRAEFMYDTDSGCFWYCQSSKYLNAERNPKIGFYNNYVYMIIATNDNFKENLVKLIEQLPN